MRFSSLAFSLAALVAVSPASAAQPTSAAAPTLYGRAGVGGSYGGGNVGLTIAPSVALGVRLPSGLEVGGYVTRVGYGNRASVVAFGPEAQIERALSPATTLNLRASGGVGLYDGDATYGDGAYRDVTGLAAALEATVTRRFDLGRGIDLAATGGVYGSTLRLSGIDAPVESGSTLRAEAGVLAGLQLEFDAFGGRMAIGPSGGGMPILGRVGPFGTAPYLGTSRNRGFITFSF